VGGRALTQRQLNRAVLARQGLLDLFDDSLPRVLERVAGIQVVPAGEQGRSVGHRARRRDQARAVGAGGRAVAPDRDRCSRRTVGQGRDQHRPRSGPIPPSGTWARRRADLHADAESWIGPPDFSASDARALLGSWRYVDGRIDLTEFDPLPRGMRRQVEWAARDPAAFYA
jgi:hypothetical protein